MVGKGCHKFWAFYYIKRKLHHCSSIFNAAGYVEVYKSFLFHLIAVVEALHQNIIKRYILSCNSQFYKYVEQHWSIIFCDFLFRLQSINVTEFDDGNFSL